MTVAELIQKLEAVENKNAKIAVVSSNFEMKGSRVEANHIFEFKGKIAKQLFVDGFDYTSYEAEVIDSSFDGDGDDFIEIM